MSSSTGNQDYVPQGDWPSVSVMLDGFGAPTLPDSDALAGRSIDIAFENGWVIAHEFHTPNSLTWTISEGDGIGESGTHPYRAVEVRPSVFLIDFLKGEGANTHDVSIVLDLGDGKVTVADTGFVDRAGERRTRTDFLSGRVVGTGAIEPRERSAELVGKRILYRYSATERYEHIYLNAGTFVWHCLDGGEKGLADVDQTMTFELGDGIVMFFWTESVMPVDSFLIVDLQHRRSIGRMFCWDATTADGVVHVPFDSRFTVLNETVYPTD